MKKTETTQFLIDYRCPQCDKSVSGNRDVHQCETSAKPHHQMPTLRYANIANEVFRYHVWRYVGIQR